MSIEIRREVLGLDVQGLATRLNEEMGTPAEPGYPHLEVRHPKPLYRSAPPLGAPDRHPVLKVITGYEAVRRYPDLVAQLAGNVAIQHELAGRVREAAPSLARAQDVEIDATRIMKPKLRDEAFLLLLPDAETTEELLAEKNAARQGIDTVARAHGMEAQKEWKNPPIDVTIGYISLHKAVGPGRDLAAMAEKAQGILADEKRTLRRAPVMQLHPATLKKF